MKFLLLLAFILGACSLTFAAEARGFYKYPDHPGKCVHKGLVLSAGEEGKLPGVCARMLCGEHSFATIQTCGAMMAPPGCRFGDYIDINAPYSECCKKEIICDIRNTFQY